MILEDWLLIGFLLAGGNLALSVDPPNRLCHLFHKILPVVVQKTMLKLSFLIHAFV